jgi:hypothetical protein
LHYAEITVTALVFMAWAVAGWDETRYNRLRLYLKEKQMDEQTQEVITEEEERENTETEQEESNGEFGDADAGPDTDAKSEE